MFGGILFAPKAAFRLTLALRFSTVFRAFPSLKQRSDWHLLCIFRPFFDRAYLNAALSSENGRKTVKKRKSSANLNAA